MRHATQQHGFTLIEMIVSLGVFAMVATTAVGALLMLVATNEQLQTEQSIMTNLSFALDSMTREIRTGTHYYCVESNSTYSQYVEIFGYGENNSLDDLEDSVNNCANGQNQNLRGLAFKEGGDSISASNERILYFFDENAGKIYRRVGSQQPESIVSSGVYIQDFQFIVTGTEPLSEPGSEREQPKVTILIKASETADGSSKVHRIQTTVTQRTIDL